MPNGYKKAIFYNGESDKIELLNNFIFKYWENYIYEHWMWTESVGRDKYRRDYEDKIKMLMDRCGTFLLLGQFRNGMIMTDGRERNTRHNEIPVSCTSTFMQDLFYAGDVSDEDYNAPYEETAQTNKKITEIDNRSEDTERKEKQKQKRFKNYKKSNQYKMDFLYKKDDFKKPVLYKLLNKDIFHNDEFIDKFESRDKYEEWLNKPFRNVHKENLYDIKQQTYKGHDGYIDKSKPYVWEWVAVDTNNRFEFKNHLFEISNQLEVYQCDPDNNCEMDKVLCYEQEQDGEINRYFFDCRITNINMYVKEVIHNGKF
jgi:hypothetical protein